MEIVRLSFNAIVPLFIVMLVGYWIDRAGYVNDDISKKISGFTFNILMPFNLFNSIYSGTSNLQINSKLILWILIVEILSFVVAYILANTISRNKNETGALIQGIFRANMLVFGLPIAQNMLDTDGIALFTIALLIILPVQSFGTIVGCEMYAENKGKTNIKKAIIKSLVNHQTIGMLIGMLFIMFHIELPIAVYSGIKDVAKVASPLSLMLIGMGFKSDSITNNKKNVVLCTLCRLFIFPLIFLPVLKIINLTYSETFILLILCCAPTATSIYPAVEQAGLDKHIAKGTIVITTICSLLSLTIWVYVLQLLF